MARQLADALEHILAAMADVAEHVKGKDFSAFAEDRLLQAGLQRWIEIVSEASRAIPEDIKSRYPDVPWRNIAGIGNILRHNYDGVTAEVIWEAATIDLPALSATIVEIRNDLNWPDADKDGKNKS